MKKIAKRDTILTPELLEANGWTWDWPNDHCNYKYYSKKGYELSLKYYSHTKKFSYKIEVRTVGELKDLSRLVYGEIMIFVN